MDEMLRPVLTDFGAAVSDGQQLEFALLMVDACLTHKGTSDDATISVDSRLDLDRKASLSRLIHQLHQVFAISATESDILEKGRLARNFLVHRFFTTETNLRLTLTPEGCRKLQAQLEQLRTLLRAAIQVTDHYVDELLRSSGLSTEQLKRHAMKIYYDANDGEINPLY